MWSIISPKGTEVSLAGLSVALRSAAGAGMPPFEQGTVELAQQGGLFYQQSFASARRLLLRLVSRQRQATLHSTRLALINALNPDLVQAHSPAYLRYTGGTKVLQLPVIYDGGLEDGDAQALELRFLAYDPAWTATSLAAQSLAVRNTIAAADYLLQRSAAGVWSGFPSPGGAVNALLVASDGSRYIGGEFAGYVRRWDATGGQWVMCSGLDGDVTCLAEGPDGTIYAGGSFSTPGNYVARWDGANWAAVGSLGAASLLPYAMVVGPDGRLYIGGLDLGAGDTAAVWDGASWAGLAGGPGGTVYSLAIGSSGVLLVGGNFAGGVQRWTGALWRPLGEGISKTSDTPTVRALARGPDGLIYAGGDFDHADGAWAANIARWTGTAWLPLGNGVDAPVYALAVREEDGLLFAAGQFGLAGGLAMPDTLAQWNGYAWFPLDVDTTRTPASNIVALAAPADRSVLIGYGSPATATSAAVATVTNQGSAAAYPILTIQGPGRVYQLVNWTAGEAIYFNLVLLDGETLSVDLRPERKTIISSFQGSLLQAVVPGSGLATWRLLPGDNQIGLFVDDADASASLTWYERHWSLDGAE